jgi:hypothetical protein
VTVWADVSAAILAAEATATALAAASPMGRVLAKSRAELVAITALRNDVVVAFVDLELVHVEDVRLIGVPLIGIVNDTQGDTIAATVAAFQQYPWLTHVVSLKMLGTPHARVHVTAMLEQILDDDSSTGGIGRFARLATASKREQRFDRMREFFGKHRLSSRTITAISEIAEELVMNALYDAPVEAGHFKTAVPRTQDVDLPPERACEISYGVEDGNVFIRVTDTFGSLGRRRLLDVLGRCSKGAEGVELDESRGGAGLGLWRIFSAASAIAITVAAGERTDMLVRIATKDGRIVKQLAAVSMRFIPLKARALPTVSANDQFDMFDNSVTLAG